MLSLRDHFDEMQRDLAELHRLANLCGDHWFHCSTAKGAAGRAHDVIDSLERRVMDLRFLAQRKRTEAEVAR
jgi:hypothetical protein